MTLYLKVKGLAENQGMTIRALELKCGFGNGTIRKWEQQSPSFDKVVKLANELSVSLQYFATDAEEITPPPIEWSPGEKAVFEQIHPLSEAEKFKLAGALPFIRMMQEAPVTVKTPERERAAVGLFKNSTSSE